jgi:phage-related baseplate assembly protein
MSRFSAIDLSAYPVSDVLETLAFEAYLARDRADLQTRWAARREAQPELPEFDALFLDSDPSSAILQTGSYRELLLRARINDAIRSLTLAGALGRTLDHIGVTYYRTERRVGEDDETYRQRLALAPESWSTAGPVGAYVFWALSASPDVLDVAVYSEDEGVCLAPRVRVVTLPKNGVSPAADQVMRDAVLSALSRPDRRPMADLVTVEAATPLPFNLTVTLKVRSGASAGVVTAAARARLLGYVSGRLRWAGDGEIGPTWLIGRTFTVESLAGAAMGGDPNILEVDIAGGDINPPHAGYTEAALEPVGQPDFEALAPEITAHLFRAPILGELTLQTTIAPQGWIG